MSAPLFCVGELVWLAGTGSQLWRVQQTMYRSWFNIKTGRYDSGYGYKMPLLGVTGHYWMEHQLVKPPADLIVSWKDCIYQPPLYGGNIFGED